MKSPSELKLEVTFCGLEMKRLRGKIWPSEKDTKIVSATYKPGRKLPKSGDGRWGRGSILCI
jgi:hypothetical protein